jgi:cytochrome c biogenesis protein CcdA/thiol-disulfide isomerase/thioredoxin
MPMLLQSGLALLEGFGLAFSPCILPVLPLILAGGATGDKKKPFGIIFGFILSFTVFSLISRQLLGALDIGEDTVRTTSYALLALLGIVMLVPFFEEAFSKLTQGLAARAQNVQSGGGFTGGIGLGLLIGIVWTPCAGPILAAALLQVIQSKTSLEAALTVFLFSLGAAIPMLAIALSGKALAQRFGKHTTTIRRTMGVIFIVFAGLGLAGVNIGTVATTMTAPAPIADSEGLKDGIANPYAAPELAGAVQWISSPPLKLSDLKGKVVLVDFWTYSCINCLRTLPYLKAWHEAYHDKGLVIIGVHAPEFAFEGKPENVEAAVKKYDVKWPVAMDNDFRIWGAYANKYWPAHYLIDKEGKVVYTHFGEGKYDVTEHNIRHLLGVTGRAALKAGTEVVTPGQTPETYLGAVRAKNEWTGDPDLLPPDHWFLNGKWKRTGEFVESGAAGDGLVLFFSAKKAFLVMESADGKPLDVRVGLTTEDGKRKEKHVSVGESRLYEVASFSEFTKEASLEIAAPGPGLRLYAFTFEGGK